MHYKNCWELNHYYYYVSFTPVPSDVITSAPEMSTTASGATITVNIDVDGDFVVTGIVYRTSVGSSDSSGPVNSDGNNAWSLFKFC